MCFKSNVIIIGAVLVLNGLPKYRDKINTQSALNSHRKKKILATVPTTVMHGTEKKFNRHSTFNEKNIFVSCYTTLKTINQTRPSAEKNIFVSGYGTTMAHGNLKNSIGIRPSPEKNLISGYNTNMVHGTYKSFSWYLILTE